MFKNRVTIDKYDHNTVITIRKVERIDSGKYKLVLTNTSGMAETSADGVVLGKPAKPGKNNHWEIFNLLGP